MRASGSTWTEVDAEGSLRASFGYAVRRRAPQSASADMSLPSLDRRHAA